MSLSKELVLEIIGFERSGKEIALGFIDVIGSQHVHLPSGFDTLGKIRQTEILAGTSRASDPPLPVKGSTALAIGRHLLGTISFDYNWSKQ